MKRMVAAVTITANALLAVTGCSDGDAASPQAPDGVHVSPVGDGDAPDRPEDAGRLGEGACAAAGSDCSPARPPAG